MANRRKLSLGDFMGLAMIAAALFLMLGFLVVAFIREAF